jgi:hypothetical protein
MGYREGDWYIYCDICGQRSWASETTKLSQYTGRGGLIVCRHDTDKIDPSTIPYTPRRERLVDSVRTNHTNTTISSPYVDLEAMAYSYFLTSSQDNIVLSPSQNNNQGLTVLEPL